MTSIKFLTWKLVNVKYKECSSTTKHWNEFKSIVNQLSYMKMVLENESEALLLLSFFLESWEALVVFLSNSAMDGVVTMSWTTSSLLNEKLIRKNLGSHIRRQWLLKVEGDISKNGNNHFKARSKTRPKREVPSLLQGWAHQEKLLQGENKNKNKRRDHVKQSLNLKRTT